MKADISRDTFQAARDIRRVVAQQGRPWLDADWNEQVSVLLHRLETLAADLFGEYAAIDTGFQIEPVKDKPGNPLARTFSALRGRYYVHGLMCENDEGWVSPRQDDFENGQTYLVYLHAWEEYDSGLQDPSQIEPALRGIDTSGRTRVRWQIGWDKVKDADKKDTDKTWSDFKQRQETPAAKLKIRVKAGATSQDPCRADGRALYRGLENALYRVEAYKPKTGNVQLKWSRNNASSLVPVSREGKRLRCARPAGLDASFDPRGWIEVHRGTDEDPYGGGTLHRIDSLDREAGVIDLASEPDDGKTLFARPWAGVIEPKSTWAPLEQGLEISLDAAKGELRAGQYWLIPVRTEGGGQVYWPTDRLGLFCNWIPLDDELGKAPAAGPNEPDLSSHDRLEKPGVIYRRDHFYGPLALITFDGKGELDKKNGILDLRKPYAR